MEQLNALIERGAAALGAALDGRQVGQLLTHLELLEKWNAKLNLVGPGTKETWACRHTLDSLAVAEWLPEKGTVIDVGSGAGFPGVPLAVYATGVQFILVEPRANRGAFLQNVIAQLGLRNTRVSVTRAEALAERAELVTGRAVAPSEDWANIAGRLCSKSGKFVLFAQTEPATTIGGARREAWKAYRIDGETQTRAVALYVPRETPEFS